MHAEPNLCTSWEGLSIRFRPIHFPEADVSGACCNDPERKQRTKVVTCEYGGIQTFLIISDRELSQGSSPNSLSAGYGF